ncbi:MAG: sugar phosphate isomerase/epimerase family protein [Planctomycetota bacterium]
MPDLIGIAAGPAESVPIAARAGFEGIDMRINRFADEIERLNPEALAEAFDAAGLKPGYCSIGPMKMDVTAEQWEADLCEVPRRARIARQLGYSRATSVVVPGSDSLAFDENFAEHVRRIEAIASIIGDFGMVFGLEYVSPLTRRAPMKHQFVYDLRGMLQLLDAVAASNVGVMLDSFHWHCADESAADLRALRPEQVVSVHVCDLIAGVPVEQQVVTQRELPGLSGIIDMTTFLRSLAEIGYDGPICAEPTHPRWQTTETSEAARMTARSILECMEHAGVGSAGNSTQHSEKE